MLMMAAVIKWTNLDNCMPEVARTVKSTSYCVEKEFHARMRDLKGKFFLKLYLADYNYIS